MAEETRFRTRGSAVPPDERPTKRRTAVRILLRAGEQLLFFRDTDPGLAGAEWWMTPGGGVDEGETWLTAAARELAEETGWQARPDDFRGPIAFRTVVHGYSDQVTWQDEAFFVIDVPAPFVPDVTGHTEDEQLTVTGSAWLRVGDHDSIPVWPRDVARLVELADHTEAWPVDLGEVEESTVGVSEGYAER